MSTFHCAHMSLDNNILRKPLASKSISLQTRLNNVKKLRSIDFHKCMQLNFGFCFQIMKYNKIYIYGFNPKKRKGIPIDFMCLKTTGKTILENLF